MEINGEVIMKKSVSLEINEKLLRILKEEASRRDISVEQAIDEAVKLWIDNNNIVIKKIIDEARKKNNMVYKQLKTQLQKEYPKKWIAISNGKLVAIADSFEQLVSENREIFETSIHVLVTQIDSKEKQKSMIKWRGDSLRLYKRKL